MMGIVGSLHCIGMCGPLAIVANRIGSSQGALNAIIYNTSRISIYILLGAFFGLLGQVAIVNGLQKWLSVTLGAAIIFLTITYLIKPQINNYISGKFGFAFKLLGRLNKPGEVNILGKASLLGIINGFLPCGLVYMALAGALVQRSLLESTLFMFAFGLGTLPMMFSITVSGNKLFSLIRGNYRKVLTAGLFFFGGFLVYRGLGMEFTAALNNLLDPVGGVVLCE